MGGTRDNRGFPEGSEPGASDQSDARPRVELSRAPNGATIWGAIVTLAAGQTLYATTLPVWIGDGVRAEFLADFPSASRWLASVETRIGFGTPSGRLLVEVEVDETPLVFGAELLLFFQGDVAFETLGPETWQPVDSRRVRRGLWRACGHGRLWLLAPSQVSEYPGQHDPVPILVGPEQVVWARLGPEPPRPVFVPGEGPISGSTPGTARRCTRCAGAVGVSEPSGATRRRLITSPLM